MTDEKKQEEAIPQEGTPQLNIQKMFVRDISFEAPNSPDIFGDQGQMDVQLNISQKAKPLSDDVYEVVLTVTVTSKMGDKTAYLVEVQQGGLFGIRGFEKAQLHAALGSYCPGVLFPYARQVISEQVAHGGFPPLVLQHMNFDAMYAEQMRKQQEEQQAKD